MATMTLRLDHDLQRDIESERKKMGLSRSEIVRQALAQFLKAQDNKRFMAAMVKAANASDAKMDIAYAEEGLEWGDAALSAHESMKGFPRKKTRTSRKRS